MFGTHRTLNLSEQPHSDTHKYRTVFSFCRCSSSTFNRLRARWLTVTESVFMIRSHYPAGSRKHDLGKVTVNDAFLFKTLFTVALWHSSSDIHFPMILRHVILLRFRVCTLLSLWQRPPKARKSCVNVILLHFHVFVIWWTPCSSSSLIVYVRFRVTFVQSLFTMGSVISALAASWSLGS